MSERKGYEVKGYKAFNPDWTCMGFQYEVGKTYEMDGEIEVCRRGFHFCQNISDCFSYYDFDSENKVAEVIALGNTKTDDGKSCTNKIYIVREITWEEVLRLANSGNRNSGYGNSGNENSGDKNSGYRNSGDWNSGNGNSGNENSGYRNSGDWNSGNWNSGDRNSGDRNSGDWNSGDWNSGNRNSGYGNSGYGNSGNRNSRNGNSGDRNSGDRNSGDWNLTDGSSGCFNTKEQTILFFDKESDLTLREWRMTRACALLDCCELSPMIWICEGEMSDKEKAENKGWEVRGGYLKENNTKKAFEVWWSELSPEDRDEIKSIPNFDAEKFYKITGLDVEKE